MDGSELLYAVKDVTDNNVTMQVVKEFCNDGVASYPSFTDNANKVLTVNTAEDGVEWTTAVTQVYVDTQDSLLQDQIDLKADAIAMNQVLSTKADLVGGLIPASQLPSYVDDVLSFVNLASFPVTGEDAKIYIAEDVNKTYRWSGSSYVEIGGGGVALGETSSTAYRGDRGKVAYDHSLSQGNPHNTTTSEINEGTKLFFTEPRVRNTVLSGLVKTDSSNVTNTDTVEIAVGKLAAKSEASGSSGFNWVDITTVGTINSSLISYTSANYPNDTCKIEVARKDGMLWIRGDFYVTTAIPSVPVNIFEITSDNYKILHQVDVGARNQLVTPTARGTSITSSIFTYIPSRVGSIADIATVLEFRVASISAAATAPVHIPVTCVGELVI